MSLVLLSRENSCHPPVPLLHTHLCCTKSLWQDIKRTISFSFFANFQYVCHVICFISLIDDEINQIEMNPGSRETSLNVFPLITLGATLFTHFLSEKTKKNKTLRQQNFEPDEMWASKEKTTKKGLKPIAIS